MFTLQVLAADVAEELLAAEWPRRWVHVQAVAGKAKELTPVVAPEDRDVLVAAAWLHDIGYSSRLTSTGMHALDGARWLANHGYETRLASLVAHHSCAMFEAQERGLERSLVEEFEQEHSLTADALWLADMTIGPNGQSLTVQERLADIHERYGEGHVVSRQWHRAERTLLEAVERVERLLCAQPMNGLSRSAKP